MNDKSADESCIQRNTETNLGIKSIKMTDGEMGDDVMETEDVIKDEDAKNDGDQS